ncbi:MAG: signal peptide peptidase SppA [Eggerthellaceae bacterium]|nr:signal peptide peptidase SppA [Eggerthellaceae bacterium]
MFAGMASCTAVMGSSLGTSGSAADLTSGPTVGIINIDGTIQYDGSTSSPEGLKAQLDRAEANPDIKAVVLRVNSGGGVATAGEEMSTYVRQFSKPVVVSSAATNASAAYELSSQADYIFTAKTTAIGAIGTAMQITDVSGLLDMLGITVDNITSSDSKDSSYGTRALTEEERAYYQNLVDQVNATFIEAVAEGRDMTEDEVRALATGLTFTGMEAVDNGLADELGTLEDACDKAAQLGGVSSSYRTVYLQPDSSDLATLLELMSMESEARAGGLSLKEQMADVRLEN